MRAAWATGLLAGLVSSLAQAATLREPILGMSVESRFDSYAVVGREADLLNIFTPTVGYRQRSEVGRLQATYGLDVIDHLRAGNVTVDHSVNFDLDQRLSHRLTLQATGTFMRVEDSTVLPRFGVTRIPVGGLYAEAEVRAGYRLTAVDTLDLRYRAEAGRLFLAGYPLGTDHGLSGGWTHAIDPRLQVGLRYRYVLFFGGAQPVADTHTVSLGARYEVTRHSFLNIEAGPMTFRFTHSSDFTPELFAHVDYTYGARGVNVAVSAGRDFVGAAGYATTIWADYLHAEAGRHFTRQLNLYAGGGIYQNGQAPRRPADTNGYVLSAGGEWRFTPSLRAVLGYDRIGQFAGAGDVAGAQLVRNLVGARLVWRTE